MRGDAADEQLKQRAARAGIWPGGNSGARSSSGWRVAGHCSIGRRRPRCEGSPAPFAVRGLEYASELNGLPDQGVEALIDLVMLIGANPEHPISLVIFQSVIVFFALACKFCNAGRPKKSIFDNSSLKLDFDGQNGLLHCILLHVTAFLFLLCELQT